MNKITTYLTKENIFIGLIISLTFLASSALIGNSLATMQKSELISVSGSAERLVKSDAGKWTFSVSRNSEVEAFGFTAKRMKEDILKPYTVTPTIRTCWITIIRNTVADAVLL